MTIYFNSEWDGGPWSEGPTALGTIRTGPLGLLSILESRCGTSGRRLSHALRIAGMVNALLSQGDDRYSDRYSGWYSASFDTDRWATAAELLSCRDELLEARIAGGDIGDPDVAARATSSRFSRRLAALTGLVNNTAVPGDGIPDRIREVLRELRSPELRDVKPLAEYRIVVQEPEVLVPPVWQTVLGAVADSGATVEYAFPVSTSASSPAPSSTQSRAVSGGPDCLVTVVHAPDQWSAAEHLAALLAGLEQPDAGDGGRSNPGGLSVPGGRPALVTEGDSGVLDQVLQRWNLPATGSSEKSAARRGLQILPAFLATFWRPADPQAIVTFLSLATGLIPAVVVRRVIDALSQHPGTGGPKWTQAIEKIAAGTDAETADFYDRLFARDLFDPEEGVPVPVLEERLRWLNGRLGVKIDQRETARIALSHSAELREIIGSLRIGRDGPGIPWSLLNRIVATVVRPLPMGGPEQAAPWSVHQSAATVPPSSGTLIVWNCVESEPAAANRFTEAERTNLADAGYNLESPDRTRSRSEWNRLQALLVADRRIVTFLPQQIRGEDARPAPWLTDLMRARSESIRFVDLSSDQPILDIVGVKIHRNEPIPVLPPEAPPRHHVPPGTISYPETLSYSAVSSLIGCPMQWTVGRTRGLSAAAHISLPTGNQMIGTLTHAIIEHIAREHAPDGAFPENAGALAGTLFDELVPTMAAELLQPGRTLARRRYRDAVISAVTALREELRRLGMRIRQVETFLEAPWDLPIGRDSTMVTVRFRGPADMELVDEGENPFVLDLKYSYAEKFYADLVARGEALQLASYAWLIEQNRGRPASGSGYFLLPRRRLITDSPRAGEDAVESARSLREIWRRGERSAAKTLQHLHDEGIVEVTGLQQTDLEESEGLFVEPPCKFCDYPIICGYGRGQI